MKKRVVVTGLGILSPLGLGVEANREALFEGRSGVDYITRFTPADDFPVKIAGEVKGFDPKDHIDHKDIKKMDRFIHYAIACTKMAMDESGLQINDSNAERVGVIVGVGLGGLPAIEKYHNIYRERGVKKITPFFKKWKCLGIRHFRFKPQINLYLILHIIAREESGQG